MSDLRDKITAELDRRAAQIDGPAGISAVAALWLRVVTWGRDVIGRHTPIIDHLYCREDGLHWPCPEVRSLATALGIEPGDTP